MKACCFIGCHSTVIAGRCNDCERPLCGEHLPTACSDYHLRGKKKPAYDRVQTIEDRQEAAKRGSEPVCWLCEQDDRMIYRGLATLGITYSGQVRFICEVCVDKVKQA